MVWMCIFRLPYPTNFGGVTAVTKEQFEAINGFSNIFYGWGGEDDDLYNRFVRVLCDILVSTVLNDSF